MAACGLGISSGTAAAATFCVGTSTELQQALMTAASNGEADTVRIRTGLYAPGGGSLAFAYFSAQNFAITIAGGYVNFGMVACGLQLRDPSLTLISGSNARGGMALTNGTSGDISLEGLTFRNGLAAESGGGLRLGAGGYVGDVLIDRVFFDRNVATSYGGGLSASVDGGTLVLRNSLFLGNRAGVDHAAASLTVNATSPANYRAFIGNNTVVDHACGLGGPTPCGIAGIRIGGSARAVLFNNAFGFNSGADAQVQSSVDVFNNSLPNLSGTPGAFSGNLTPANPLFVNPLDDDYRLQFASPLRNAGTGGFLLGAEDFAGAPRLNDGQYDIGAYENNEISFKSGFETLQ